MADQNFPEPGTQAEVQNIHGRAGQNLSLDQLLQQQKDESAAIGAATPAPAGFPNFTAWAEDVSVQLIFLFRQLDRIMLAVESLR